MALRDVILADSPTNYWEFAETSGTTLTATTGGATMSVVGSVNLNQTGPAGSKAVTSAGGYLTNAYADLLANTNATIEFWFKVPAAGAAGSNEYPTILRRDGSGRTYLMRYREASLASPRKFETYINARSRYSTSDVNDAQWHHYVLVKSSTTWTEYLDGNPVNWWTTTSGTISGAGTGTTQPFYVLADGAGSEVAGDLSISNLVMYNTTALSEARVNAHWVASNIYAQTVLTDSPLVYYKLDETTGNAVNYGSLGSSATYGSGITRNQAPATNFIGDNSVSFNNTINAKFTQAMNSTVFNGDYSFEVWFKTTDLNATVFVYRNDSPSYMTTDAAGLLYFRARNNENGIWTSFAVTDGNWHHAVGVSSGSNAYLYVDGALAASGVATSRTGTNTNLIIGDEQTSGNAFNGNMDEIAIYPTALSAGRVLAHYNAGLGNFDASYTAQKMTGTASMGDAKFADARITATILTGTATMPGAVKKVRYDLTSTNWAQFGSGGSNGTEDSTMDLSTDTGGGFVNSFVMRFTPTETGQPKNLILNLNQTGGSAGSVFASFAKPNVTWNQSSTKPSFDYLDTGVQSLGSTGGSTGYRVINLTPNSAASYAPGEAIEILMQMTGAVSTTRAFGSPTASSGERPYLEVTYEYPASTGVNPAAELATGTASAMDPTVEATDSVSVTAALAIGTADMIDPDVVIPDVIVSAVLLTGFAEALNAIGAGQIDGGYEVDEVATGTAESMDPTVDFVTDVIFADTNTNVSGRMITPKYINGNDISFYDDPYYILAMQTTDADDVWYRFKETAGAAKVADERRDLNDPLAANYLNKDGVLVGNPDFVQGFGTHRAIVFDGLDDYIQLPDSIGGYPELGPGSTEFYVKTTGKNQKIMIGRGYRSVQAGLPPGTIGSGETIRTSTIELVDGKVRLHNQREYGNDLLEVGDMTGVTDIADGEWHQVVITTWWYPQDIPLGVTAENTLVRDYESNGLVTGRGMSIFIDGKLDQRKTFSNVQDAGAVVYIAQPDTIGRVGNSYFTGQISELIHRNYFSLPKYYIEQLKYAFYQDNPVRAEMINNIAAMGNHKAKGNTKRVLVLFFNWAQNPPAIALPGLDKEWSNKEANTEPSFGGFVSGPRRSQSGYASLDINDAARLFGGSAFFYQSVYQTGNGNSVDNLFRDAVTDEPRYIDLQTDIDITDFDAIMFADFPGVNYEVNNQMPIRNRAQKFDDFIESIKKAVFDDGVSLYVTMPHLAQNLGLVSGFETELPWRDSPLIPTTTLPTGIPARNWIYDWKAAYNDVFRNPYAKAGTDTAARREWANENAWMYWDTHTNKKHRIVNLVDGLTNIPGYTFDEEIQFTNLELSFLAGYSNEAFRYTNHENGVQIGDEFIMNGPLKETHQWAARINQPDSFYLISFAPEQIVGGTVVAKQQMYLDDNKALGIPTTNAGSTLNPKRENATVIIVEPGTEIDGRVVNGRIVVDPNDTYAYTTTAYVQDLVDQTWTNEFGWANENDETLKWNSSGYRITQKFIKTNFETTKAITGKDGSVAIIVEEYSRDIADYGQNKTLPVRLVEMPERLWNWLLEEAVGPGEGGVIEHAVVAAGTASMGNATAAPIANISVGAPASYGVAQMMKPDEDEDGEITVHAFVATATGQMYMPGKTVKADIMVSTGTMIEPLGLLFDTEDIIYLTLSSLGSAVLIREGDSI